MHAWGHTVDVDSNVWCYKFSFFPYLCHSKFVCLLCTCGWILNATCNYFNIDCLWQIVYGNRNGKRTTNTAAHKLAPSAKRKGTASNLSRALPNAPPGLSNNGTCGGAMRLLPTLTVTVHPPHAAAKLSLFEVSYLKGSSILNVRRDRLRNNLM